MHACMQVAMSQLSSLVIDEVLDNPKEKWKELTLWATKEKPSVKEVRKKAKVMRKRKSDRTWDMTYVYKLLSALQKDIRRGNEEQALFWATELEKYDYSMLWNRLEVMASEDIGVVNPNLPVLIRTLRHQYEDSVIRRNGSYRLFLSNAIIILSRSPEIKLENKQINVDLNKIVGQTRVADDLLWKVYGEKEFEGKKFKIPNYALDKHTGMKKEGTEKWIKEGTKLVNEVKFKEDGNPVNPYTEEANRIRLEYGKLPKIFPKRRNTKGD